MASSVSASQSAQQLLQVLRLPAHAVTVWPTTREGEVRLVVRVTASETLNRADVPATFNGYRVVVERGGPISAH